MVKTFNDMVDIRSPKELFFSGIRLQQAWTTLYLLEDILDNDHEIKRIIELGTGYGGLALFFGLHMFGRGMVLTFDIDPKMPIFWYGLTKNLPISFVQADIFCNCVDIPVSHFLMKHKALVFCDAGEKKDRIPQIEKFAKFLKPDDLLLAHDYYNSIQPSEITHLFREFASFRQADFDSLETYILSLVKK